MSAEKPWGGTISLAKKLYYGKNPSITLQLERLNAEFDGTDQLVQAIFRKLKEWDDVWGQCSVRISNPMTTSNWSSSEKPDNQGLSLGKVAAR